MHDKHLASRAAGLVYFRVTLCDVSESTSLVLELSKWGKIGDFSLKFTRTGSKYLKPALSDVTWFVLLDDAGDAGVPCFIHTLPY